jgi:hypothetical protein
MSNLQRLCVARPIDPKVTPYIYIEFIYFYKNHQEGTPKATPSDAYKS